MPPWPEAATRPAWPNIGPDYVARMGGETEPAGTGAAPADTTVVPFRRPEIAAEAQASPTTVVRVARYLKDMPHQGYRLALDRLKA